MKTCTVCNESKELTHFVYNKRRNLVLSRCKECTSKYNANYRQSKRELLNNKARDKYWEDPEVNRETNRLNMEKDIRGHLLYLAKSRSVIRNIPYDISKEDIKLVKYCPILNVELKIGRKGKIEDNSFTLDKVIPSLGYIKGNVRIISAKANRLKSNASVEELESIINYIKEH